MAGPSTGSNTSPTISMRAGDNRARSRAGHVSLARVLIILVGYGWHRYYLVCLEHRATFQVSMPDARYSARNITSAST
jgi:hypothetical protein